MCAPYAGHVRASWGRRKRQDAGESRPGGFEGGYMTHDDYVILTSVENVLLIRAMQLETSAESMDARRASL